MNREEWRATLAAIAANPDESGRVRLDALEVLGRDRGWTDRRPRRGMLLRLLDVLTKEGEADNDT